MTAGHQPPAFPYLRLRLTTRPDRGPHGAVPDARRVRRAFGRELIRRFCPFGAPRCQDADPPGACPQLAMCSFAQVFARFDAMGHCARPPFSLWTGMLRGRACVDVTLFARAWPFFLWTVQALEDALTNGIGGPQSLWRVDAVHRVHADGRSSRLILGPEAPTPDIVPDALPVDPHPGDADLLRSRRPVAVELVTPARLVHRRRALGAEDPVPFALLVARASDRLRDLYGDEAAAAIAGRVGDRDPAAVPLIADHTRFVAIDDWSAKKRRSLPIGGKQGVLVYGSGAAAFLPLLRAAEITHVGKNAASGLGRIRARLLACSVARHGALLEPAQPRDLAGAARRRS